MSVRTAATATREAVPAATVAVVRDHADGLQVLLQERALASDFVGGAWVFPGGKVDGRDAMVDPTRLGPVDLAAVHGVFGSSVGRHGRGDTLALLVAAIRETFEEAGVLLAHRDGRPVDHTDLAEDAFTTARAGLADRERDHDWRPFLHDQGLVLDLAALRPLAWWVTPHGVHRRFSTRFFVAVAPAGQQRPAGHDAIEMTATVWTTPAEALAAAACGERQVIFPTRTVLSSLVDLPDVAAVSAHADAGGFDLRPITPLVRRVGGRMHVQHPDGGPPEDV